MKKIIETTKAILKAFMLMFITAFALTTANAEKFNPTIQADLKQTMLEDTKKLRDHFIATAEQCKRCLKKTTEYEATMRDDKFAKETLITYKANLALFCGPLISAQTKQEAEAEYVKKAKSRNKK